MITQNKYRPNLIRDTLDPVQRTFGWEDFILRISGRPPSWISERTDLCNSESPCCLMPPPIKVQFNPIVPEMLFEGFQDVCYGGHLGY